MRLDKFFSENGILSRSECKKELKKGNIAVNGVTAKKAEQSIDPQKDQISYQGKMISYEPNSYYMLCKPNGVISATKDEMHKTVIDLLKEQFPEEKKDIFPVGRLDIDTEGLLLLTNDGALSHELLSPAKHVEKTYLAWVSGRPNEAALKALEEGVDIGDDKPTKPALCRILEEESREGQTCLSLSITEGRYHQVKRMCAKVGHPVIYLKRISFGPILLDESLELGEIRKLSEEEIKLLKEG